MASSSTKNGGMGNGSDAYQNAPYMVELPELQSWSHAPALLEVESSVMESYSSNSALGDGVKEIRFVIPENQDAFTDLYNSELMVEFQVKFKDGKELSEGASVSLKNNFLYTAFADCSVFMNNIRTNANDGQFPWVAYLESYLTSTDNKTCMRAVGWADEKPVTATMSEVANFLTGSNDGANTRSKWCSLSKTMQFIGKLPVPSHSSRVYYAPNIRLEYVFKLAEPQFSLFYNPAQDKVIAGGGSCQLIVKNAAMIIKRVRAVPKMKLAVETKLQTEPICYPVKRYDFQRFTIPKNTTSFSQPELFSQSPTMPKLVIFMMIDSNSYLGNAIGNPFYFRNAELTDIQLQVGSQFIPQTPYKLDFTPGGEKWTQLYVQTLKALSVYNEGVIPTNFSYDAYGETTCIMAFDLTTNLNTAAPYNNTSPYKNSIRLLGSFKNPTSDEYAVLSFAVYENMIYLNEMYQISTDY